MPANAAATLESCLALLCSFLLAVAVAQGRLPKRVLKQQKGFAVKNETLEGPNMT